MRVADILANLVVMARLPRRSNAPVTDYIRNLLARDKIEATVLPSLEATVPISSPPSARAKIRAISCRAIPTWCRLKTKNGAATLSG